MKVEINDQLLEACKLAEQLIARINYAFYVKGKTKDLLPVMAETKPALTVIRSAISKASITVVDELPITCEGKSLQQMAAVMIGGAK